MPKRYDKAELFERMPIPKAVAILAIPTIFNQLITTIYNLADTFFVGQTGDPNMVAAVSLCMPAMWILTSLSNLFGIGGGSLISRCLGAKETTRAKRASAFSTFSSIGLGLIMMFLVFLFPDFIARTMGASDNTIVYVKQYLFWATGIGAVPTILAAVLGNHIRAEGSSRHEMIGMVSGNILNLILDPIFIFVFRMGVAGAALATMLSNLIAVSYYLFYITSRRKETVVSLQLKDFSWDKEIATDVFSVGFPASLTTLLGSLATMLLNILAAGYGDNTVAACGIVKKIDALPRHISGGLTQGVLPLIGYNFAAKNYKRMEDIRRFAFQLVITCGVIFALFFEWQAPQLIRMFIDNQDVVAIGTTFLRIICVCSPMMAINYLIRSTFQAVGCGRQSLILALCRQGIIYVPLMLLLNRLFGLLGLFWAQPVADVLSLVLAYYMYRSFRQQLGMLQASPPELAVLPDTLE